MNNTTTETNYYPIYSIQYIILSGYVILSWGHYNIAANLSKAMLLYLNMVR